MKWNPERKIIGCIAVVEMDFKIVGIECTKGRGIIMPGGKHEVGESFHETASRELKEETGLDAFKVEYIHRGADCDGTFCYAFRIYVLQRKLPEYKSKEGKVGLYSWDDFFTSYYHGFYRVLKEIMYKS